MKAWIGVFCLGMFSTMASAQSTYTYTGQNFGSADAPYTTSDRITGSFQLSAPLPPNAPVGSISAQVVDFSFTDGQATRTFADSVICEFRVSTNASGGIQSYEIWLRQSDTGVMENQHSLEARSGIDIVGFDAVNQGGTGCAPVALSPTASNVDQPGLWSGGVVPRAPVPSLSLSAMLLLAAAMLLMGLRPRS